MPRSLAITFKYWARYEKVGKSKRYLAARGKVKYCEGRLLNCLSTMGTVAEVLLEKRRWLAVWLRYCLETTACCDEGGRGGIDPGLGTLSVIICSEYYSRVLALARAYFFYFFCSMVITVC